MRRQIYETTNDVKRLYLIFIDTQAFRILHTHRLIIPLSAYISYSSPHTHTYIFHSSLQTHISLSSAKSMSLPIYIYIYIIVGMQKLARIRMQSQNLKAIGELLEI